MSMSKATEVTTAIRAVWAAVEEITCPVAITSQHGKQPEVHVLGYRALEQIPGKTVHKRIGQGRLGLHEMSRELDGIKFYCLLSHLDYNRLVEEHGFDPKGAE